MARSVKCNICGSFEDGVKAIRENWRLYFQAIHPLWDPEEPVKVEGLTVQYIHVCPTCAPKMDALLGDHKSFESQQIQREADTAEPVRIVEVEQRCVRPEFIVKAINKAIRTNAVAGDSNRRGLV